MAAMILALAAIPLIALLPMALGRKFMGRTSLPAEHYALGLLVLCGILAALAAFGRLGTGSIFYLNMILLVLCYYELRICLQRGLFYMQRMLSMDWSARILFILLLLLMAERALRCLLPTLNWDSLGHHLLLVRERLHAGSLAPLWPVPTDRRTPMAGVLVKSWAFAFDPCGRTVLWLNFCIMLAGVHQLWTMARERLDAAWALLVCAFYVCLTDIFVHAAGAGDEPLLTLLLLIALRRIAPWPVPAGWKNALFTMTILGFALAVKMTVLFWLPLLLAAALFYWRKNLAALLCGLLLLCALAASSHIGNWSHYHMAYPFTRWSNLLYEGQGGVEKIVPAAAVRADRLTMGLAMDENDRGLHGDNLQRFVHNLKSALHLPMMLHAGWCLLLILLFPGRLSTCSLRHGGFLTLFAAGSLLSSFMIWPLSPQAMMRYHMPLWPVFLLLAGGLLAGICGAGRLKSTFVYAMIVFAIFSLSLEGRVSWSRLHGREFLTPCEYWRRQVADGPLLKRLEKLRQPGEVVFYCGAGGFLLEGHVWFAQMGNEAGWRPAADMPAFLKKNDVRYWVLGHQPAAMDDTYQALTNHLLQNGTLALLATVDTGRIYAVSSGPAPSRPQTANPP